MKHNHNYQLRELGWCESCNKHPRIKTQIQSETRTGEVTVVSFGHRYGTKPSGLVVDARALKNPYHDKRLRKLTGRHPAVKKEVLGMSTAVRMIAEARAQVHEGVTTVSFGCTAGRHRSVVMAEALSDLLQRDGYTVTLIHKEANRWR